MLNPQQGNDLIKNWLIKGRIFACCRIGLGGDSLGTYDYYKFGKISERSAYWLRYSSGFYGDDSDMPFFAEEYAKGLSCADIQVKWNMNSFIDVENLTES